MWPLWSPLGSKMHGDNYKDACRQNFFDDLGAHANMLWEACQDGPPCMEDVRCVWPSVLRTYAAFSWPALHVQLQQSPCPVRLPRSLPRTPPSTGSCVELLSWSSHKVRQPSDPPWPLMAGLLRLNSRKRTPQGLHRNLKREG